MVRRQVFGGALVGAGLTLIILYSGSTSVPFIYFQFKQLRSRQPPSSPATKNTYSRASSRFGQYGGGMELHEPEAG
jgi:hypothetical protein